MPRKKTHRVKKIEPAVQTMQFDITIADGVPEYIDLSQCASLLNRRFYRQGLNWVVQSFKIITTNPGTVGISKLQNTWIQSNAWEKSFRTWMRMNEEALEENPSVRPRFLDFKIYADAGHHQSGFGANLLPSVGSIGTLATATPGEWEASKIVFPDSSVPGSVKSMELIAVGPNYPAAGASGERAVSIIEGYSNSRSLPNILDPNLPNDADDTSGPFPQNWMGAIFNEGTVQSEEVLDDVTGENNLAPYPFENDGVHINTMYPGGEDQLGLLELHDISSITPTTIGGHTTFKGGNFPCGLIRLDWAGDAPLDGILLVNLVPGHHRGYLAESMTEM